MIGIIIFASTAIKHVKHAKAQALKAVCLVLMPTVIKKNNNVNPKLYPLLKIIEIYKFAILLVNHAVVQHKLNV